jgi:SAM-dependent methyltransferase
MTRETSGESCSATGCCADPVSASEHLSEADVRDRVREGYSAIAKKGVFSVVSAESCCSPGGGCCGATALSPAELAEKIGYSPDDLSKLPEGANMGLSCGNPTAIAALKPGEVLVDLGSGGGFDCFLAGPKVGESGRIIGVDMTPDMITKARRNIAAYKERTGLENVEFRLGEIEHLPVADASADVIISNCVINLSPDKGQVWREMHRVLKPGGRVAVSDLALRKELPAPVKDMVEALVGCVAGAALIEDTRKMAHDAGFRDVQLTEKTEYVDAMTSFQDPLYQKIVEALPKGSKVSDYVVSLDIAARK